MHPETSYAFCCKHAFPLQRTTREHFDGVCCYRHEKLKGPRVMNKLKGARLDTCVFLLLLPSLVMQPWAYPRVARCSSLRSLQRVRWAPSRCELQLHQNAPMCPTVLRKFTGVGVCWHVRCVPSATEVAVLAVLVRSGSLGAAVQRRPHKYSEVTEALVAGRAVT